MKLSNLLGIINSQRNGDTVILKFSRYFFIYHVTELFLNFSLKLILESTNEDYLTKVEDFSCNNLSARIAMAVIKQNKFWMGYRARVSCCGPIVKWNVNFVQITIFNSMINSFPSCILFYILHLCRQCCNLFSYVYIQPISLSLSKIMWVKLNIY